MFKKIVTFVLLSAMISTQVFAEDESLSCKSALLMDFDSGKVLYEMNPHEKLPPASVTKIMTMLLTMEEIQKGRLKYDDIVTASAYAKSMGGSTIFLDEGEQMTVDDLLKGIAVSSGNDACVAIAEHIAGNTDDFVSRMNERAKELGMNNTNFVNCNGLDTDDHYTTAYDIALMSRELMKHEDIFKYTTIWMDSLRNGEFTLSNTNKLIRFYEGATGLKTGSTSKALFCISATAKRDNLHLISVIMGSPTSKERQKDASSLLNYGFGKYKNAFPVKKDETVPDIKIEKGVKQYAKAKVESDIKILTEKTDSENIEIKYKMNKKTNAPIKEGDIAGKVVCIQGGKTIGSSNLVFAESVDKVNLTYSYGKCIDMWLGNIK
jgi:D-alanyl-D-alanine carboxypeptidase (penicillin-binding protein 5/6)